MKRVLFLIIISTVFGCSVNQADDIGAGAIPKKTSEPIANKAGLNPKEVEFIADTTNNPIIKPSFIIGKIRSKLKGNSELSAKELAEFGNELLITKGYDYTFSWEPKGKENEENLAKVDYDNYIPFFYEFTLSNGKPRKFQLMNRSFGAPCFSVIDIPVSIVTGSAFTVFSDETEHKLKRPKDFYSEEIVLVDRKYNPIRRWSAPIDAIPVGISEDGKMVYFWSWEFDQDQTDGYKESPIGLVVEISENGSLRFVDRKELESGEGVVIDHDKKYTEIQYERYTVGKKEFIIKYSGPCT